MDKTTEQSLAIVRPLRHFEVDRYWVKVTALAVRHSWIVVFDQFSWRRLMMPALVAVVASGIQFYVMGWASTEDNIKILGTSVAAGLCVFGVLVIIHLVRKPCELQINATEEIGRLVAENERLRQPAIGLALSEEDPIVNFDPLNSEFLSQGYVPFMLSNKGQRVNPAHGVTVLPMQCAPSVRFEYVDRVDANEEKRMVPIVDGFDLLPSNNILPELRKAWSDAHEAGGFDDAEFPFEITIKYRDAKRRTFQATVSLRYCPLEEDAARRSVMSGQRQMAYAILKVTDSGVMRLS